ncbi:MULTISPECIES: PilC/PilY family type IV pilus protein [unclassified Acinetobacter calcoaceticus/baumannii complex]|uniref:PilC/PilY family type IV pilus protein n=1 Tax=Acinetobacter sp. 25977_8 TaxID=1310912 RepID=UPI0004F558F8|nr:MULTISPECIES: PilC/PilY family type IV pilus protein [unclassified Acinetobacter calcoaceticus/baumannii complex]
MGNIMKLHFKPNKLWYAIYSTSMTFTWLMSSSVVQASDLQIYASPTAGKKTIVMMLDTSGSMGRTIQSGYSIYDDYGITSCSTTYVNSTTTPSYRRYYCGVSSNTTNSKVTNLATGCEKQADNSYRCYDRLTRLKDGMFSFLENNNPIFNNVSVGLGHFSTYSSGTTGDGSSGEILVPAANLGVVGSAQRVALKNAVAGLEASGGTPTANAYAEAAAYLMGTRTLSSTTANVAMYFKYYPVLTQTSQTVYYACGNNSASGSTDNTKCTYTPTTIPSQSNLSNYSSNTTSSTNGNITTYTTYYYKTTGWFYPTTTYYYKTTYSETKVTSSTPNYQSCTAYNSNGCTTWSAASLTNPTTDTYDTQCTVNTVAGTCVYQTKTILGTNSYSGFNSSVQSSKDPDTNYTTYKSPLPPVSQRQSCDGQGVYILSDGEPTNNVNSSVLASALNLSSFSNSGGLSGGTNWDYMSNFAKALFNGGVIQSDANNATNPANVSIQTAFVGFGSALNALSTTDAKNACKMSSRTQIDRSGDDACSPNQGTNAVSAPGYGNGGFFPTQSAQGVTDSVIAFINNLGKVPLEPLTTGAISVPYDALNPKNLQEYGYLRAFEPDPANAYLTWRGNLKKYHVVLSGSNAGAFEANSGGLVYDANGAFRSGTKDYWNSSSYNDGGKVFLGGAYSNVPLPTLGQPEEVNSQGNITKYYYAAKNKIRNLFTDVSTVATDGSLTKISTTNTNLLKIPAAPAVNTNPFDTAANTASYVLGKFNSSTGQDVLKAFPVSLKLKLLNYLGYPTDITATALPSTLTTSNAPYLSMGGSIHSFPVQLTYSGTLDQNGNLTSAREQSILYGSMEGGLHIVDASSGVEQMVFTPADILNDTVASKALVVGQSDSTAPAQGMDGAWVSDPAYNITTTGSGSSAVSKVTAKQMNIYGGMRMGGSSYYGLNVLNPSSPQLMFRIGADQSDYSRMGQSWSKPVLANIRYNGAIRRVMIVGGGYDQCYEKPNITLSDSCFSNGKAKGNAVYIIDAKTGERLWWASDTGSNNDNANMKHSIVSRISTLDRDGDGLVDHLYFGDLGGQVFRVDLNNNQTQTNSTYSSFGIRVVRLANLATNDTTNDSGNDYTGGNAPRFYEPPTVTIHDYGVRSFITVGIASGDRSTPLDVYPIIGREGMSPSTALSGRPVNNVYGIIDRDFIKKNLMSLSDSQLETKDLIRSNLRKNPQILRAGETSVGQVFFPSTGIGQAGWYRSLSSTSNGTEKADNSFRIKGGMKAFEEPIAITGNLIVPVYDPQGTGIVASDPCLPRVVGETDRQTYCLPFGVCLNTDGSINHNKEDNSGFGTDGTKNLNVIGSGVRNITFVPSEDNPSPQNSCGKLKLSGNEQGTGQWQCTSYLIPARWYERYR